MEYLFRQTPHPAYYNPKEGAYFRLSSAYIEHIPNSIGKHRIEYRVCTKAHRTDGPALYTWDTKSPGLTKLYYVDGVMVNPEVFECVLSCPLEELSLLINVPVLNLIAIDRLKGERSTVDFRTADPIIVAQALKMILPKDLPTRSIKTLPYNLTDPQNYHKYLRGLYYV